MPLLPWAVHQLHQHKQQVEIYSVPSTAARCLEMNTVFHLMYQIRHPMTLLSKLFTCPDLPPMSMGRSFWRRASSAKLEGRLVAEAPG